MAFVAQPSPRAVPQSSFGFGFLSTPPPSMSVAWPSSSSLSQSSSGSHNSLTTNNNNRVQKRRLGADDDTSRDESMEPPQRTILKRPRLQNAGSKLDKFAKDSKPSPSDGNDVDVGLLLASLPSQSLLPILNSLISAQPGLKSAILPLIPRPTLPAALEAILQSAEALRNSYPYSQAPTHHHSATSSGFGSSRATGFAPASIGFSSQTSSAFGGNTGMSESYIASRIRPHVDEFTAVCVSYMPYFSFIAPSQSTPSNSAGHAAALQAFHKDERHPGEVFTLLAAITTHFLAQPPLTQSSLAPLMLERMSHEWNAWVSRLDQMVNVEARMFGSEAVTGWANELEDLAARAQGQLATVMHATRDQWVQRVGWLIGRGPRQVDVQWG